MRDDDERSNGLESVEVLVHSVLEFGMNHTKSLRVKELRVLIHYHFRPEKLKGVSKKVELVEDVT